MSFRVIFAGLLSTWPSSYRPAFCIRLYGHFKAHQLNRLALQFSIYLQVSAPQLHSLNECVRIQEDSCHPMSLIKENNKLSFGCFSYYLIPCTLWTNNGKVWKWASNSICPQVWVFIFIDFIFSVHIKEMGLTFQMESIHYNSFSVSFLNYCCFIQKSDQ